MLEYSTPSAIKKTTHELLHRMFPEVNNEPIEVSQTTEEEVPPADINSGVNKFLMRKTKPKEEKLDKNFKLLESRGELTSRLLLIHNALLSIRPTSPLANKAKTKLRNGMSANSLNSLVLFIGEKYHFRQKKTKGFDR